MRNVTPEQVATPKEFEGLDVKATVGTLLTADLADGERVALLPARAHRRDQVGETVCGTERSHRLQGAPTTCRPRGPGLRR